MFDDAIDLTSIALKGIGKPASETDSSALRLAEITLVAQKPYVSRYEYETVSMDSGLISGAIWMTPVYNGDGIKLQQLDHRVKFNVPREGTSIWVDYIMVLKKTRHAAAAWAFVDYLLRPEVAARISAELMFATPNTAALALLPPAVRDNTAIYPDDGTIQRSEVLKPLSDEHVARRNAIADRLLR
jgi:spermidine/putrescine transport system substrate-binding protein